MSERKQQLLSALADGEFHSGQRLAQAAGISRTAVWKHLQSLAGAGLAIETVRGKGYRLARPLELLHSARIREAITALAGRQPPDVEVLFETPSTNRHLLEQDGGRTLHGRALLAEYQSAGRGRGANQWLSAPASGICLSLGWQYQAMPESLTGLSLAVGVAVAETLESLAPLGARLKWPNDIVVAGAKLGGILIESRGQSAGSCDVVVGIGINVHLPPAMAGSIDKPVTDLGHVLGKDVPSRNRLAAMLIDRVAAVLEGYGEHGFTAYIDRWRALDYTRGKTVQLLQSGSESIGQVIDIDDNGLLILSVDGERKKFSSGELSLRLQK